MATKALPLVHRNLPLLLLQARERVIARFRGILHAYGLTEQQWRIVRALVERGSMEPREIVEACTISSPSLAGVLTRMEALDLVTRERLDHDQRRVRVSATPRSIELAHQMAPEIERAYAQLEHRLGKVFTRRLYDMLDEAIAGLETGPP